MNVVLILILLALVLFVLAIIKPSWPLTPVGGIILCVAMIVQFYGK